MLNLVNRIIEGDCLEVMGDIPDRSIDLILCDLPYGTTSCSWDIVIPLDDLWVQYKRILKEGAAAILFGSQPFTTDLINSNREMFKYSMVWEKNVPTGMAQAKYRPMKYHEDLVLFCKGRAKYNPIPKPRVGEKKECYKYDHYCGPNNHINLEKKPKRYDPDFVNPSSILKFNVVPNRGGKLHPTQKPVELCDYLIRTYSNQGDLVLDNCIGSGTTAIAALGSGRKFIGIESDARYVEIARKRVGDFHEIQ